MMRDSVKNLRSSIGLILLVAATGCASQKAVPKDAVLVAQGPGPLGLKAPENGIAFITSRSADKVIFNSQLNYSDLLLFDPKAKRVLLNGRVVKQDTGFDPKQVHRLY